MTQKKKVNAIFKKENKILVSRPIIFNIVLQIEGIYGNGDEIMNCIQMACERFQNLAFVMSILVIKVVENLLTNPRIIQSSSQEAFFPEVLRYVPKKTFILSSLL
jgi:hypothetical protein